MTAPILRLCSFGVSFGGRVILTDVTLELPRVGMTIIVGPAGGGKSTLLRTLAGLNDAHPALGTWGDAIFDGQHLGASGREHESTNRRRPSLIVQHARFFLDTVRENLVSALPNRAVLDQPTQTRIVSTALRMNGFADLVPQLDRDAVELSLDQQRSLAVVRALVPDPLLLFADEPTAGLHDHDAAGLITALRFQATMRSVVFVTHNQQFARAAGGTTLLLAGGRIQEIAPSPAFFSSPQTDLGKRFVRTGGCPTADPDAPPENLIEGTAPVPLIPSAIAMRRRQATPRGFFWVEPGRLGGLPRPGIIDQREDDLDGLKRLGVTVLVTLEETRTVDPDELAGYDILSVHFPVVDMSVPALEGAIELCRRADDLMRRGEVVAFHCRAGLGRTGTLLACWLIWSGATAMRALESVRAINPRCVQSDAQVAFLPVFEKTIAGLSNTERMSLDSAVK